MSKSVHPAIIHKYSQIDVMQVCETVFKECKLFTERVHSAYKIE